jgi:hypothetical protein
MENITIHRFEQIYLHSKAIISDPYLNRDEEHAKGIDMEPGCYWPFVATDGELNVAMLFVAHESLEDQCMAGKGWKALSNGIVTHSGRCGIFDDTIYPQMGSSTEYKAKFRKEAWAKGDYASIMWSSDNPVKVIWGSCNRGIATLAGRGERNRSHRLFGYRSENETLIYSALAIDYGLCEPFELIAQTIYEMHE